MREAKAHFMVILDDPENRVVALSGKWGTGKSHMWRDIQKASTDEAVKNALYVSLFGVSNMGQLKLKIVQSAIGAGGGSEISEALKSTWRGATKVLRAVHPGFAAMDEIAALAVPAVLRNRFIVIDDIERKHEKLSIDEVLGFIDEYTQNHGARIQLILNSDQLHDKQLWETLREKVIDQEVRLDTSPAEAFDIAITLAPSRFAAPIRSAVEICRITNIRIIRKVIRAVNRILDGHDELPEPVLSRVIPSTVLLSAIHYKGIEDGPDFAYVLSAGLHNHQTEKAKKDEKSDEAGDKLRAQWATLLGELRIYDCDEYEMLVADYLNSGLFDASAVASIVSRYANETRLIEVQSRVRELHTRAIWHPEVSDAELLKEAESLVPDAHLLDCYAVTALHDQVAEFEGGREVAAKLITNWVADFLKNDYEEFEFDNFYRRPVHPEILAAFDSIQKRLAGRLSLADVCRSIRRRNSWGTAEEVAMRAATVEEYEELLRTLTGEDLRMFLLHNIELYSNRSAYEKHFGQAMEMFAEACRRIYADTANKKRRELIRGLFDDAGLVPTLESQNAVPPAEAPTA